MSDSALAALLWLLSRPSRRGACPVEGMSEAEWTRFTRLAIDRHRVGPLVAARLGEFPFDVPGRIRERLDAAARENALAALRQKAETLRLCDAMRARQIGVVVLKGWPLAEEVYGAAALRHAKDIDLLVAPEDVEAAKSLLRGAGYSEQPAIAPWRKAKDAEFLHAARGVAVELHWRLFDTRMLAGLEPGGPGIRMWRGGDAGPCMAVPAGPTNLIYLAMHGGEHGWERLKWLLDIAHILADRSASELAEALAEARRAGAGRALLVAMHLAGRLLAAPLPTGLPAVGGPESRLLELAERAVRDPRQAVDARTVRLRQIRITLGLCEGAGQILPALYWKAQALRRLLDRAGIGTRLPWRGALGRVGLAGFPWPMPAAAGATGRGHRLRATARRLRRDRWPPLLRPLAAAAMVVGWPAGAGLVAWLTTRSARFPGRARWAEAVALWARALRHNALPSEVAIQRLTARVGSAAPIDDWLLHWDEVPLRQAITPRAVTELARDKAGFAAYCRFHDLPHPALFGVWRGGRADPGSGQDFGTSGAVFKPVAGFASRGIEFWARDTTGWSRGRVQLDADGLRARLAAISVARNVLAQEELRPPERFPGLPVARVLVGKGRTRPAEVLHATVSVPAAPRQTGQRNMLRLLDVRSGRIQPLTPNQNEMIALGWRSSEDAPDPGREMLPFWNEAVGIICRGHEALPAPTPLLLWEVAFTDGGPSIIEANASWDVPMLQEMLGRPVSEGRFLEILTEYLP